MPAWKIVIFSPKKTRMYINRLQLGPPPHPSILWFGANTITITESTGKQGAGVLPQGFRMKYCWWFRNPARKPVEVGSFSHYLQGFHHHPRWWSPDFFHQYFDCSMGCVSTDLLSPSRWSRCVLTSSLLMRSHDKQQFQTDEWPFLAWFHAR